MARRPKPPETPKPAELSVDKMKQGITILERRIGDLEKFNPAKANAEDTLALETSIEETLERVEGHERLRAILIGSLARRRPPFSGRRSTRYSALPGEWQSRSASGPFGSP